MLFPLGFKLVYAPYSQLCGVIKKKKKFCRFALCPVIAPCVFCSSCSYREGNGVQRDVEAAAWYLACASSVSYARYHLVGQQPIVEKQRLTEANEEVVSAGQLGEEDGLIQYQVQKSNAELIYYSSGHLLRTTILYNAGVLAQVRFVSWKIVHFLHYPWYHWYYFSATHTIYLQYNSFRVS